MRKFAQVTLITAANDAVLAVAVANLPGLGLEVNGVVLPVVLVWYIFTELGSIAENAAAMGPLVFLVNLVIWLNQLLNVTLALKTQAISFLDTVVFWIVAIAGSSFSQSCTS